MSDGYPTLASYITDFPPTLETIDDDHHPVRFYLDKGDDFTKNLESINTDGDWTTYLTKTGNMTFERRAINIDDVTKWAEAQKHLHYVLRDVTKIHGDEDDRSFTSYLVWKAGLGDHRANAHTDAVVMKPYNEVIWLEWNWMAVASYLDPDATTTWWWHLRNLRR